MNKQPFLSKASEFTGSKRRVWHYALGLALSGGLAACGSVDTGGAFDEGAQGDEAAEAVSSESAELINNGGLGATGGGCTVTAGPYKGRKGKYDSDGWCCFSNVCVDCAGNRCKDRKLAAIADPIVIGDAATITLSR